MIKRLVFKEKIALISVGVLFFVSIFIALFVSIENSKVEASVINEKKGEYLITNVPKNCSFKISASKNSIRDIKVADINGNNAKISIAKREHQLIIEAPEEGYIRGQIYTIDLPKGYRFKDKLYQNANKIIFIIECENLSSIEYKKRVIELEDGSDVKIKENTIAIDGKYRSGDILLVDTNKDSIDEIYKLQKVEYSNGVTSAKYIDPRPDEVYKKIVLFYNELVDFSDCKIDEGAFAGVINEMGIWEAFVEESYAASDKNIEVTVEKSRNDSCSFVVMIKDPKDHKRQLEISFKIRDKLLVIINNNIAMVNNTLTISNGLEFSISGSDSKFTEKRIKKALKRYVESSHSNDKKNNYEIPVAPIKIPIVGSIYAHVDIGLTSDLLFSNEFNAGVEAEISFVQGVVYDLDNNRVKKKYGDMTGDLNAHIIVKGELYAFAGVYAEVGLDIMPLLKIGLNSKGGPYLEGEGCFYIKGIPKDIKTGGYYRLELGLTFKANAKVKLLYFDEKTINIVEAKKLLYQKSNYLRCKGLNIKEQYVMDEYGIKIGELIATYYSLIEEKYIKIPVEKYKLYIDHKEVNVKNGIVTDEVSFGRHKLKATWKYEGKYFSKTYDIVVSNSDPWLFFLKMNMIGKTFEQVEDNYGILIPRNSAVYSSWQDFTELGYDYWFVNNKDFTFSFDASQDLVCEGMAGSAEQLFGIKEAINLNKLSSSISINDEIELSTTTDVRYNSWQAKKEINGDTYLLCFYLDSIDKITNDLKEEYRVKPIYNIADSVTLNNIEEAVFGYKDSYITVEPSTRIVIVNQNGDFY